MSWGPSFARMYGESDAEMRERIDAIKHRLALRGVLAKLGIKSAQGAFPPVSVKVNGTTVAVHATGYSVSYDIKPIQILGKFEVEEYE